jgi:hypothetical protein
VITQERDDTAGRRQPEHHHDQHQDRGDDRPVHQQQHRDDHHEDDALDDLDTAVAGDLLIRHQSGHTGDEYLDARRRGRGVDDLLGRFDGFVGQRLAHVAGEIDLSVGRLPVGALSPGLGQGVAPEVQDVLDMFGVCFELVDHVVVVVVSVRAQGLLALEDDHHRAVGLVFVEDLTDAFGGDHRWCVVRAHRHRAHLTDGLQRRYGQADQGDDRDPADDDQGREFADEPGDTAAALLLRGSTRRRWRVRHVRSRS